MIVERTREQVERGATLDEALAEVKRNAVFTIHTPISAGNERFESGLVRQLAAPLTQAKGLDIEHLLELGRGVDGDAGQFDMTAFSLRLTNGANAVSRLHAETANSTWAEIAGKPILAVTNGVHPPTWIGGPFRQLYEQLGADLDQLDEAERKRRFWEHLERIPAEQLWAAHLRQKLDLAFFARRRLQSQLARHGEAPGTLQKLGEALDPEVMTIGFARRFATYKRASLLFSDEERLERILWHAERPVQIVFAGKAHPADRPGQSVIQDIWTRSRAPRFAGRVFVMEDYDIRIARYLVQGVDVWLNNPRRPLEASGTSGMKAAMNGTVNVSVLDGWWDEGFNGRNGWAIGGREAATDEATQDWNDAQDLYRLLEDEIVPGWYERDEADLPRRWLALMRESMASALWQFSTSRMLEEYVEQLYLPAAGVDPASSAAAAGARQPAATRAARAAARASG
jgi:starch phosphorylase